MQVQQTKASILCAVCGIKFIPQNANICNACTLASVQQQKIFSTQNVIYCRFCQRYQRPPWIHCDRQSKQMLAILLKKVKGLNQVKLLDAKFLWTQPHSKRIKIKISFEKEINNKMKLEQSQVLEFTQVYTQCNDCKKQFTPHDWNTVVQIRQYADHKKTIHTLQQMIIKRKLNQKMMKLEDAQNGFDVFFKKFDLSKQFVDFVKSSLPCTVKNSKQFISANERDNTANIKTTISIIISKISKDDLVRIPLKLTKQLGGSCSLLVCTKVTSLLHFFDVHTFKKYTMSANQYFLYQDKMIVYPLRIWGKKFQILDCQLTKTVQGHLQYPIYNLSIMKDDDFKQLYARSYFQDQCGNQVQGFDLTTNDDFQSVKNCPQYIIVKKYKNKQDLKNKRREKRKLQKLANEASEMGQLPINSKKSKKQQQLKHKKSKDQNEQVQQKKKKKNKQDDSQDWDSIEDNYDSDLEFEKESQTNFQKLNQKMEKLQLSENQKQQNEEKVD